MHTWPSSKPFNVISIRRPFLKLNTIKQYIEAEIIIYIILFKLLFAIQAISRCNFEIIDVIVFEVFNMKLLTDK